MPLYDPPILDNERDRLAALASCEVLDTPPEPAFDDLARLAAEIFGVPIALVSLVDEDRQWFKSRVGLDIRQTSRKQAFCAHAIMSDAPLLVTDTLEDPRFREHPLVVGEPRIRFYAGVPLTLITGERLGTLCVIDRAPRRPTELQMQRLTSLARQVSSLLELRRRVRMLREAEEDQKRLIEELRRAKAQAEEASRVKGEFLANMSHEIRTPLTAILGYAELFAAGAAADPRSRASDRDRDEAARTILRNGRHLLQIINDILDISKIEAGRVDIERFDIDPAQLIEEASGTLLARAERKGLRISTVWTTPKPGVIGADPIRLRQILINIIGNAVKFTSSGGVTVRVGVEYGAGLGPDTPQRLRIEVEDTGIGMTSEEVARLFRPFVQADSSTTRRFGGTGLGLHISKRFAQMLGGDISVRSSAGVGSVFTIEIDAKPCGRAGREEPQAQPRWATDLGTPLEGARVLVAEDGPDNQRLARHLFMRAGAVVTVVENGREALEAWRAAPERFSLIIMDMQMPVMDGYDAVRALRDEGCPLPIVALTANAMEGDRDKCIEAGCTGYATKPIDRAALIELCRSLIAGEAAAHAA